MPREESLCLGDDEAAMHISLFIGSLIFLLILCDQERVDAGYVHIAHGAKHKCFSCMSRYYGATWHFAGYSKIYLEPLTFTDDCGEPLARGADVPVQHCDETSNCITMVEDLKIGVGAKAFIRGCYNSIFVFGFNRTGIAGKMASKQGCFNANLSQVINGGRPFDSQIKICSCAGELCNGEPLNSVSSQISIISSMLLFFIFSVFLFT
ncbi:unnamed protein product, partial [Mesorhabditis belari]|uniref:Uncharacterized protein n=1 Tax=Mesorhabditis belari TaxID=2138241 RepID=A0AAF3EXB8_9BILA